MGAKHGAHSALTQFRHDPVRANALRELWHERNPCFSNSIPEASASVTPKFMQRMKSVGNVQVRSLTGFVLMHYTRDELQQHTGINGFCNVFIHAHLQAVFPVSLHGMRGHGEDGKMKSAALLPLPNGSRRSESIHVRHL